MSQAHRRRTGRVPAKSEGSSMKGPHLLHFPLCRALGQTPSLGGKLFSPVAQRLHRDLVLMKQAPD